MQKIDVENVFEDEKQNKASIFSGSFRYLAPIVINAIANNNFQQLKKAASFNDAIYNLTILEAIKKSANENSVVVLGKGNNKYV